MNRLWVFMVWLVVVGVKVKKATVMRHSLRVKILDGYNLSIGYNLTTVVFNYIVTTYVFLATLSIVLYLIWSAP